MQISDAGLEDVGRAIRDAEKRCNAEFFAVLAFRSGDYRMAALAYFAFWLAGASLLLALFIAWQQPAMAQGGTLLLLFAAAQVAAYLTAWTCLRLFPDLAIHMVPERISREQVHLNAVRQFRAHGIDSTSNRNGILVFVSLGEKHAEILADRGIEEKLGRQILLDSVSRLVEECAAGDVTQGIASTLERLSCELASVLPPDTGSRNELADRIVILPAGEAG